MKGIILATLALVAGILETADAQLLKSYGVKVAITSTDLSYPLNEFGNTSTSRRVGVNAGAFVEWLDLAGISIVTQVEYAQRGVGQEYLVTGASGPEVLGKATYLTRLDYVSVPLLAKYTFHLGQFSPYLLVGPRADFFLGYASDEIGLTPYRDFKTTSFGGSAGLGIQIESNLPFTLLAEARYNFDVSDAYSSSILKIRNNAFDLWLGVAL